jgi:hypothetical protein
MTENLSDQNIKGSSKRRIVPSWIWRWLDYLFFHQQPVRITLAQELLKRSPFIRYSKRLEFDAVERPQYGYALYCAARLARTLGQARVLAIEFGVAGGNGLVNLESHARQISKELGIGIDIVGFDSGSGLPPSHDYRDQSFSWQPGDFPMDLEKLKARLTFSRVILGDVAKTVPAFLNEADGAPLGCCFFDLDYYSSTREAFRIFDLPASRRLPRIGCYFDDIIGDGLAVACEFTGELAAIQEFNAANPKRKIAKISGLDRYRKVPAAWNDRLYMFHDFSHSQYSHFIIKPADKT